RHVLIDDEAERDVRVALDGRKSRELEGHGIETGRKIRKGIPARVVAHGRAWTLERRRRCRHSDARNGKSLLVVDSSSNGPGLHALRKGRGLPTADHQA